MQSPLGQTVTLARESRRLSQSKLAKRLLVAQGTLSKIERGQLEPGEELLERLSEELRYPRSLFKMAVGEFDIPAPFFRKKLSIRQGELNAVSAQLILFQVHIAKLLDSVALTQDRIPRWSLSDFGGSVEAAAVRLRKEFGVPPGPIKNLTALLEECGVLVVSRSFEEGRIDGVSFLIPGFPPVVVMHDGLVWDRWRFTLAHELSHVLFDNHRVPGPAEDVEKIANTFAPALLMPASDIEEDFMRPLTLVRLAELKEKWGVSMQALVMRAGALGMISENQKRYLFVQMSQLGYRRKEPVDGNREEPQKIRSILRRRLEEFNGDAEQLGKHVGLYVDEFQGMYPLAK
jgi:Zn-dependent peptidase ImmA (M78 family)/transcriptional regulator with XRE-family HTH domain